MVQIPLPGIPPLAIAALAIPSNVPASTLAGYLKDILDGLFAAGVHVVSYASDGSAVEQSVQSLVFESMKDYQDYKISHPANSKPSPAVSSGYSDITFKLGFYRQKPLVMIQDSKHALKTCRNNLFSGARLLVLGNHVAHYSQVHEMAHDKDSTLFRRDVEKLDRQDDFAALRLFCAATLDFTVSHRPQYLGLATYFFVFGELCDAYQSRSMSHAERFQIVLRTKFFLDMWRDFLSDSGYLLTRYFISREAFSILSTLIDGLVQLILVYRDHLGSLHPLLPWLHSTEACEHMFAELRKLVKDFTYLDFLFSIPKLGVQLRASYRANSKPSVASDPHQKKAAGYQHTYMKNDKLNLSLLSTFPTNAEMHDLTRIAYIEATQLVRALGIEVFQLPPRTELSSSGPASALYNFNELSAETHVVWTEEEPEDVSAGEALLELIKVAESSEFPLDIISTQRDNIVYASSALQVEYSLLM